jgi:PAS domain S-box-containing protein
LSGARGKHTLQALRESEERYRCLVDLSRDAILVHSEGECVLVNQAAVELFRAGGVEQLLGKPILDLVHAKDRDMIDEPIRHSAAQSGSVKRKLIRLDRSVINAEVAACSCRHNGKPAVQLVPRPVFKAPNRQIDKDASHPGCPWSN